MATRIDDGTWRTLQLALAVGEASTMQELLRPVVEEYANRLAAEPEIGEMLKQAQRHEERRTGVRSLPRKANDPGRRGRQG